MTIWSPARAVVGETELICGEDCCANVEFRALAQRTSKLMKTMRPSINLSIPWHTRASEPTTTELSQSGCRFIEPTYCILLLVKVTYRERYIDEALYCQQQMQVPMRSLTPDAVD
jgi:hypothetical protein